MKIGLVQTDIHWEDKESNKVKYLYYLEEAEKKKVDFILFPEMSFTGFSMNTSNTAEASNEENGTFAWVKEQAKRFNLHIGFGHVEKLSHQEKALNSFSVISPSGETLSKYSKIHPFSYGMESKFYTGGDTITYLRIEDFIISTFICYDLRFPEIFQLASKKALLITVGANWPEARREHWITLLKARAIENQCFIAGINRVGIGDNIRYSGDSMLIDPLGNVLVSAYNNEALLICDVTAEEVIKVRESFRLKNDRREDLYYKLNNSKG